MTEPSLFRLPSSHQPPMFQILYLVVFTLLTVLAVTNLVRNILAVSSDRDRPTGVRRPKVPITHPELLDERGKVIDEPLMVMRSASVEDIRNRLDALYDSSPSSGEGKPEKGED